MGQAPENWFILVYGLADRSVEVVEYAGDYSAAADAYTVRESANSGDPFTEVVLVGADSLETIKRTHSHYFVERDVDLFEELLLGVRRQLSDAQAAFDPSDR
jgi:hypothetical protein